MRKKMIISVFLPAAAALLVIAGCSGNNQHAPKPAVSKPRVPITSPAGAVKPEEKVEQEVYVYDPKGRRDPFMSLVTIAKEKTHVRKANPIENYDLSEIKLTAIVWDKNQYYALITLPDNKSYTIRKGMTLGLYGGKVVDIDKNSVLVREDIKDYKGQLKTKDTRLKLHDEGVE